ncbi:MAG: hypothetical protein FVQ78_04735 [Solirubrobacterales bacterium]|nr:hypothetical protein [Solirubrobacterales bacterium]
MSARITWATALRVLTQLRRDSRTIALLMVVPPFLLALLKGAFHQDPESFQRIGGPLVGLFPFSMMFVVTSITMLRERTTGTLERLMSLPLAKLDLLFGYGVAFALVATVQAVLTSAVAFGPLGSRGVLDVAVISGATLLLLALAAATLRRRTP